MIVRLLFSGYKDEMTDTNTDLLKLVALDEEDLVVLSAYLQDAVMRVDDLNFSPRENRFALAANRFVWTKGQPGKGRVVNERRRTAIHFDHVEKVQSYNILRDQPDAILSLLAIQYLPSDTPAGTIDLIFSGDGVVRLFVSCIEGQLSDLGGAWETQSRPEHVLND